MHSLPSWKTPFSPSLLSQTSLRLLALSPPGLSTTTTSHLAGTPQICPKLYPPKTQTYPSPSILLDKSLIPLKLWVRRLCLPWSITLSRTRILSRTLWWVPCRYLTMGLIFWRRDLMRARSWWILVVRGICWRMRQWEREIRRRLRDSGVTLSGVSRS